MRSVVFNALLLTPALVGCVDSPETAVVEGNIESPNALSLNALSLNALSLNALSLNALSLNGATVTNGTGCETAQGREVLKYVVGCALPAGTSVSCPGSSPTVFQGSIGLAPGWMTGPATIADRRWVSACLLAHVNNYAVPIEISLSGPTPALARSDAERETFSVQEGAFYGDLFEATDSGETKDGVKSGNEGRVACQSAELTTWSVRDWYMRMRVCALPFTQGWTTCHFVDAGRCAPPAGETTSACVVHNDGHHTRCAGGPIFPGWAKEEGKDGLDRSSMINAYVITTHVRPSQAADLRSAACGAAINAGLISSCAGDQEIGLGSQAAK